MQVIRTKKREVFMIKPRYPWPFLLAAMVIGLSSISHAQEVGAGVKASSPPARDCQSIAQQLTATFPGATTNLLNGGERWVVYLPDQSAIQIPCMKKGISLVLAEVKEPGSAATKRLTIADRSAEIFSGMTMTGGAAKCLQAVKRTQKRAGKIGRSHAREINAIPHFEGRIAFGAMTIFCRYDYDARKELTLFYDLLNE